MKTITIALMAAGLLSACSKKRTCTCEVSTTYSSGAPTTSESVTRTYEKVSKRYAKQDCSDKTDRSVYYTTTYTKCKLKM